MAKAQGPRSFPPASSLQLATLQILPLHQKPEVWGFFFFSPAQGACSWCVPSLAFFHSHVLYFTPHVLSDRKTGTGEWDPQPHHRAFPQGRGKICTGATISRMSVDIPYTHPVHARPLFPRLSWWPSIKLSEVKDMVHRT